MLKYEADRNWANNVHELRGKYNLPLNDKNICNYNVRYVEKNGQNDHIKRVSFLSV